MILKEWSEALAVYKAISPRWRRSMKRILFKVKYWYASATLIFLILLCVFLALSVLFLAQVGPKWWMIVLLLIAPLIALCDYVAVGMALAKEFEADYTTHGILRYPFWSRRKYFVYTLFLQELRDRKYSHKKVAELNEFTEIVEPPERLPVRPFQHPLVIPLIGVLTALSIEVTKQSVVSNNSSVLTFPLCYFDQISC